VPPSAARPARTIAELHRCRLHVAEELSLEQIVPGLTQFTPMRAVAPVLRSWIARATVLPVPDSPSIAPWRPSAPPPSARARP
jgi:hypothetical protein